MSLSDILIMRNELLPDLHGHDPAHDRFESEPREEKSDDPHFDRPLSGRYIDWIHPQPDQALFGGMYHTNGLVQLMKNILNIGVLIILFNQQPG